MPQMGLRDAMIVHTSSASLNMAPVKPGDRKATHRRKMLEKTVFLIRSQDEPGRNAQGFYTTANTTQPRDFGHASGGVSW